ncbi:hypothetical protein [Solitalea lacus]|uniref:hypothetical protein n=1 Tax=Solitalea lacus TaxID=2911172 RepID=UPI001ED9DC18|nr:hypothetical protein [Solitalea lacus]UKJ08608.1 hypothetical protein L2B55_05435 [Solitalea lacus]
MVETFTQQNSKSKLRTQEKIEEAEMMEQSLAAEEAITEGFENLASIKEALNQVMVEPSRQSVEFILSYSNSTRK